MEPRGEGGFSVWILATFIQVPASIPSLGSAACLTFRRSLDTWGEKQKVSIHLLLFSCPSACTQGAMPVVLKIIKKNTCSTWQARGNPLTSWHHCPNVLIRARMSEGFHSLVYSMGPGRKQKRKPPETAEPLVRGFPSACQVSVFFYFQHWSTMVLAIVPK